MNEEESIDLHGRRMNATMTAPGGVIDVSTIFVFQQEGEVVSAEYRGGRVRRGSLVGVLRGRRLEFRYAQLEESGYLDGGHSECEVEELEDGRVRIVEHFEWAHREGKGTNVIEELPKD